MDNDKFAWKENTVTRVKESHFLFGTNGDHNSASNSEISHYDIYWSITSLITSILLDISWQKEAVACQ